jgi:poly-beta-1,6-N-acetyl-D-glucosamine synthase
MLNPFYTITEKLRQKKFTNLKSKKRVSIIVPAWNEEVGIIKTVKSILQSTYVNIEIVVVNDGSTDDTEKNILQFLKMNPQFSNKVKYIYQKNSGKGVALNTGIKSSTGSIILTCDADSQIEKNAILNLVKYFRDPEIKAVVGNVKVYNTATLAGQLQQIEYLFSFYNKRAHAIMGAEYIFGGACAAFRRSVFSQIGYFDEDNKTEDIDMSMRTRLSGMKCTYAEDVICYTEGASRLRDLVKQRTRWKKGRFDTFYKYKYAFFSLDKKHNKLLTWFILPLSIVTEIQLLLEPIAFLIFGYITYLKNDTVTIGYGLLFMFVGYLIFGFFNKQGIQWKIMLGFPITWLSFYLLNWVEYLALLNSIKLLIQKQDITWQKWQRVGIDSVD